MRLIRIRVHRRVLESRFNGGVKPPHLPRVRQIPTELHIASPHGSRPEVHGLAGGLGQPLAKLARMPKGRSVQSPAHGSTHVVRQRVSAAIVALSSLPCLLLQLVLLQAARVVVYANHIPVDLTKGFGIFIGPNVIRNIRSSFRSTEGVSLSV